jgi:hypothetical protein
MEVGLIMRKIEIYSWIYFCGTDDLSKNFICTECVPF